ncbi:MAG: phospho-sugar mutase, partial [Opitutales bacterium]|nr:phospho-sugar mutase [Opitutales bacterium]
MIKEQLASAVKDGHLLASAEQNINEFLNLEPSPDWVSAGLEELLENNQWEELNDRFHQNLAFGTGGMRGRTIGKIITSA